MSGSDAPRTRLHGTVIRPTLERLRAARQTLAPRGTARGRPIDAAIDAYAERRRDADQTSDLRILVAGPPKAGNMWVKCLLASIYGLRWGGSVAMPAEKTVASLREHIAGGGFLAGTVFHQHYDYADEIVDLAATTPFHLLTVIRDPYDLFVSLYYHQQNRPLKSQRDDDPRRVVIGKPLDHPDVLRYLAHGFDRPLKKASDWLHSGRSIVIRYEDLHRDPVAELTRVTALIRPVESADIERAVEACSVENMRKINQGMAKHVRSATVGDSRQRLGPAHLAVFREHHAELIHGLGYEVR